MGSFWGTVLIWATWHLLHVLAVETVTTLPPKIADLMKRTNTTHLKDLINNTRRIINGEEDEGKPWMVYLKLPTSSEKFRDYRSWLCGGIIVHEEYILTSAACIEDVGHFYIVSGISKFAFEDDRQNNLCIKNGAKKAVWKCIPRNYVFDGHENDNIRWMNNDLAVVKIEEEFDFTRRVRGCEYAPKPICYNNQSQKNEAPGTNAQVFGWGSTDKYNDWVNTRRQENKTPLRMAKVVVMAKNLCKKRWGARYHNIIDNYMVCTNDMASDLSEICLEKYTECDEIGGDSEEDGARRLLEPPPDPNTMVLHSAHKNNTIHSEIRRQGTKLTGGGFCENDHGGPLVIGEGVNAMAIGIISACLVKEKTNQCYGPFLYTSIYKNRNLINCAIFKNVGNDCNKLFRSSVTHDEVEIKWSDHPDGPAKNEVPPPKPDVPIQQVGLVLRSRPDDEDLSLTNRSQTINQNVESTVSVNSNSESTVDVNIFTVSQSVVVDSSTTGVVPRASVEASSTANSATSVPLVPASPNP